MTGADIQTAIAKATLLVNPRLSEVNWDDVADMLPAPYVPTPDDLDQLCARIAGSAYASIAVERIEEWTREHWGVESAFTTAEATA